MLWNKFLDRHSNPSRNLGKRHYHRKGQVWVWSPPVEQLPSFEFNPCFQIGIGQACSHMGEMSFIWLLRNWFFLCLILTLSGVIRRGGSGGRYGLRWWPLRCWSTTRLGRGWAPQTHTHTYMHIHAHIHTNTRGHFAAICGEHGQNHLRKRMTFSSALAFLISFWLWLWFNNCKVFIHTRRIWPNPLEKARDIFA